MLAGSPMKKGIHRDSCTIYVSYSALREPRILLVKEDANATQRVSQGQQEINLRGSAERVRDRWVCLCNSLL